MASRTRVTAVLDHHNLLRTIVMWPRITTKLGQKRIALGHFQNPKYSSSCWMSARSTQVCIQTVHHSALQIHRRYSAGVCFVGVGKSTSFHNEIIIITIITIIISSQKASELHRRISDQSSVTVSGQHKRPAIPQSWWERPRSLRLRFRARYRGMRPEELIGNRARNCVG